MLIHREVDKAAKCAAEKLSVCPFLILSVTHAVEEYKAGKPMTTMSQAAGADVCHLGTQLVSRVN